MHKLRAEARILNSKQIKIVTLKTRLYSKNIIFAIPLKIHTNTFSIFC